ncbi:hypothetical protein B0H14DRAFT_2554676 [Mycena olivaceomarginata]|nr:hypothetical protein B0H14DRAFT_2554676 [Mycena olivaceomarginata]
MSAANYLVFSSTAMNTAKPTYCSVPHRPIAGWERLERARERRNGARLCAHHKVCTSDVRDGAVREEGCGVEEREESTAQGPGELVPEGVVCAVGRGQGAALQVEFLDLLPMQCISQPPGTALVVGLTLPPLACTPSITLTAERWSIPRSSPASFRTTMPAARAAPSRACSAGEMYNVVTTCILPVIAACTTGSVVRIWDEREDEVVHGDGNLKCCGVHCGDVEHKGRHPREERAGCGGRADSCGISQEEKGPARCTLAYSSFGKLSMPQWRLSGAMAHQSESSEAPGLHRGPARAKGRFGADLLQYKQTLGAACKDSERIQAKLEREGTGFVEDANVVGIGAIPNILLQNGLQVVQSNATVSPEF